MFPVAAAERGARGAAREAAPWIRWLARFGFAAKGIVYIIIGGIAANTAFQAAGRVEGSEGALQTILRQPFGRILLGAVAVGLAGYALWKLVEAVFDPEGTDDGWKSAAKRIGFAISSAIHFGLAYEAARMVMGGSGGGGNAGGQNDTEHWTALVMQQPMGRWAIGAVGIVVIAFGLYEIYKGATDDIAKRLHITDLDADRRRWVVRMGRAGLIARGIVFGIIGWFLIQAAVQAQSEEAKDLREALATLQEQPYGRWLLGLVALGLIGYGIWELAKARYRRIQTPG